MFKMKKNDMGGACGKYLVEITSMKDFCGDTCVKETNWKTQPWMTG
jgi:hypothetical protein